jgi:hypothetical protein
VYRRVPVQLRYKTCGGLVNQHYAHVAAVMIAAALGADIELQHGLAQSGRTEVVNMQTVAVWDTVPFGSLWNQNYITTWVAWPGQRRKAQHGMSDAQQALWCGH